MNISRFLQGGGGKNGNLPNLIHKISEIGNFEDCLISQPR